MLNLDDNTIAAGHPKPPAAACGAAGSCRRYVRRPPTPGSTVPCAKKLFGGHPEHHQACDRSFQSLVMFMKERRNTPTGQRSIDPSHCSPSGPSLERKPSYLHPFSIKPLKLPTKPKGFPNSFHIFPYFFQKSPVISGAFHLTQPNPRLPRPLRWQVTQNYASETHVSSVRRFLSEKRDQARV